MHTKAPHVKRLFDHNFHNKSIQILFFHFIFCCVFHAYNNTRRINRKCTAQWTAGNEQWKLRKNKCAAVGYRLCTNKNQRYICLFLCGRINQLNPNSSASCCLFASSQCHNRSDRSVWFSISLCFACAGVDLCSVHTIDYCSPLSNPEELDFTSFSALLIILWIFQFFNLPLLLLLLFIIIHTFLFQSLSLAETSVCVILIFISMLQLNQTIERNGRANKNQRGKFHISIQRERER